MKSFKLFYVLAVFFIIFSCAKSDKDLKVDSIVSSEFFQLEMETFGQWEVLIVSSDINEENTKALVITTIANFKKINEYFSKLNSENNTHLNDAIKNQIDLCHEYQKMEDDFNKSNEAQKVMKYFYFANKHYKLFLDNLEKAKNLEEEMEKQNEKK